MIKSISVAVPKNTLDRSKYGPEHVKAFETITGIKKTRRWDHSTSELALCSVLNDINRIRESKPVAVIVVTQSPDRNSPSMANDIALALNLPNHTPVFDVNQSCSGFIYGLWIAESIAFSRRGNVLLVCVDKLRANPETLDNLIFSDASCAAIISSDSMGRYHFYTDGSGAQKLMGDKNGMLKMQGGAVFDFVTKNVPNFLKEFPLGEVDSLVLHQANLSMMKIVEKRTGFEGRSIHSIEEFGNMSMVSIPAAIALKEKEALGKRLLLCGYGAGFSVAGSIVKWPKEPICQWCEI